MTADEPVADLSCNDRRWPDGDSLTGADAPVAKRARLPDSSYRTVVRLLSQRGLSDDEVQAAIEYAAASGARKTHDAFTLAMSRVLYSDAELRVGKRFPSD